jgi:hypothetical protein
VQQIEGPPIDDGKYTIDAATSEGATRTVIIKRTGPFFTRYIKHQYDCSKPQYRYIGTGSKSDEIIEDEPDAPWFVVRRGEWIEGVRDLVCLAPSETAASQ